MGKNYIELTRFWPKTCFLLNPATPIPPSIPHSLPQSVVGWFVARHCVTTKPSLRDLAILRQLGEYVNHQRKGQKGENGGIEEDKQQQEQQEGGCGGGGGSTLPSPTPWTPVVLIVFSLDLQPTSETQGVSYACHYLPPPPSLHGPQTAFPAPPSTRSSSRSVLSPTTAPLNTKLTREDIIPPSFLPRPPPLPPPLPPPPPVWPGCPPCVLA